MSPFPGKLGPLAAGMFGAVVVAAVLFGLHEPGPSLAALAIFVALVIFTTHMPVQLGAGLELSPGPFVCMAAIVVFVHEHSMLGVLAVCSLDGVKATDFAPKRWGWIPFNAGVSGLAYLACAGFYAAFGSLTAHSTLSALLVAVPAALTYVAVAWALLLVSYAIEGEHQWRAVLHELAPLGLEVAPFAILGFLLGRLYLGLGPAVMLLVVVPVLIAREMFGSYTRVREAHNETVELLVRALEQKDPYTAGHAGRVAQYAGYVAEELGFGPARAQRLRFAALMHDIGKLVVPNQLLNKPGKLTEEEYARVRVHEGVSVQMLSHIDFLRPIAADTHSENMRFDPDDPDHPIEPYIIMIADAYDAMTSTRSYRRALTQDVAFQELRDKSGTQFHPECAQALIRAIEKRHEVHGQGHEETTHFEDAPDAGLGSAGLGDLVRGREQKLLPSDPAGA